MKKIFFYINLFTICCLQAMEPEQEKLAKGIIKQSHALVQSVRCNLPKQPWNLPSDRTFVTKECRKLEEYMQTLQITKSYQVNKTIASVMNTMVDLVEHVQAIMCETEDKNSIHLVNTIKTNMHIRKFRFVTELYQLLMNTPSACKET